MLDKELCERPTDFLVAEGVEVAPIKRERSCVGPGPTAGAQIDDGDSVGLGPDLGLCEPWTVTHGAAHQVSMEGQESDRDLTAPGVCDGLHSREYAESLGVRHPGTRASLEARSGSSCARAPGVDLLPQERVQPNVSNKQRPKLCREPLWAQVPLDVGDQGAVEVVHGHKDDGQIRAILGHSALKKPTSHRRRVAGLSRVDHLQIDPSELEEGGLGRRSNALGILDPPAKDCGVSHHSHPALIVSGIDRMPGAQSMRVRGDLEVVGFPQARHSVGREVRLSLPSPHGVRLVGRLRSGEPRTHFRQSDQGRRKGDAEKELYAKGWRATRHWAQLIRVLLLFVLGSTVATAEVSINLSVSVADGTLRSAEAGAITAHVQWLGEERVVPLSLTESGVWTATMTGPQVRTVGIDLWLKDRVPAYRVSQGLEVLPKGDTSLAWSLSGRGADAAWRLSEPIQLSEMRVNQERASMGWSAWLVLSVLGVLLLGRRALEGDDVTVKASPLTGWMGLILWLLFAVIWTWPAVLAGPDIVGRHFDALGTVWVIDAANRLGLDLHDPFLLGLQAPPTLPLTHGS